MFEIQKNGTRRHTTLSCLSFDIQFDRSKNKIGRLKTMDPEKYEDDGEFYMLLGQNVENVSQLLFLYAGMPNVFPVIGALAF